MRYNTGHAQAVLKGFFPDEEGHAESQAFIPAYTQGEIEFLAPTLLPYEVTNAILQAVRRARIDLKKGQEILSTFEGLGIPTAAVSWPRTLELARTCDRSAYDEAYLALAEQTGSHLVTGDRRLYNALNDHLPWVRWIEDYTPDIAILLRIILLDPSKACLVSRPMTLPMLASAGRA